MYDKNFEYTTHDLYPMSAGKASSLIQALWYNENTHELLVVLKDYYQNPSYRYEGVTPFVWASFKAAQSKGAFYNKDIKGRYGPAEAMGDATDVGVTKVAVTPKSTVGTPKGLTYSEDAVVDGKPVSDETPKDVSYFPLTLVSDNLIDNPSFEEVDPDDEFEDDWNNGKVSVVDSVEPWLFEVHFVDSENPDKVFIRKVETKTVDEALEDVYEVGSMLDRVFIIRKVEVNFDW